MKRQVRSVIAFVLLSLAAGAVAGLITKDSTDIYETLIKPPFAPPAVVFPVVWTILYILMGVGAGIVWQSPSPRRETGICLFALQLAVNFVWPIIFFTEGWYFSAFLWLLMLLGLVIYMTCNFYKQNWLRHTFRRPISSGWYLRVF